MIDVFRAHDVGYFLYIGGNDSMDTANKVAQLARERGLDLVGRRRAQDDRQRRRRQRVQADRPHARLRLGGQLLDAHGAERPTRRTPARRRPIRCWCCRRWGARSASFRPPPGWPIPAARCRCKSIWPKAPARSSNWPIRSTTSCGAAAAAWSWSARASTSATSGEVQDSFGHTVFSSSQATVAQIVVNYLNEVGLAAKGAARGNVPGTDQRHSMAYASTVDLDEAYRMRPDGRASWPPRGQSGFMATILREPGPDLQRPLRQGAAGRGGQQRADLSRPQWIAPNGYDVTDDFVRYAKPLVGNDMISLPMVDGRQRMTRFSPIYAEQKLPHTCRRRIDNKRRSHGHAELIDVHAQARLFWSASTPTAARSTRWR